MSQDRPTASTEGTILSLMGQMNPTIHHPAWYSHIGVLSEEEQKAALGGEVIVTRQVAAFTTPAFSMLCDPEHWQITIPGTGEAALKKGIEVVRTVFDEGLKHTPVRAVGIQYHHHFSTPSPNVAERIAGLVSSLPLGLSCSPGSKGTITVIEPVPGGQVRTVVEGSILNAAFVYLAFSGEYPTSPPLAGGYIDFRVDNMIQKRAPELHSYAGSRIDTVLAVLGKKV